MRRQFVTPCARAAAIMLVAASLAGCGVKGPLRPPTKSTPAATTPPTTNPAAPPATTSPALPPPIPGAK